MLPLIRRHRWWFAGVALTAALLRLFFIARLAVVTDDAVFYGDIARSLIHHHGYGTLQHGSWLPTLSRLPGYPFFLAFSFLIGGESSYLAAMLLQLVFDLLACLLAADVARRVARESAWADNAARKAFLLAAFCPFLMSYVATPLTECLEIFCIAAALDCALVALQKMALQSGETGRRALGWWFLCGVASAGAILLRPDGGLILAGIGLPLAFLGWRARARRRELWTATLLLGAVALAPLVPWTVRNWRVFHVFQPLVTTHASDPGEFLPLGWERWFRSWLIDYASMEDVGFQVSGAAIDPGDIPSRACNSPAQCEKMLSLLEQYNQDCRMTPALDRQFAALADENIRLHPLRDHLLLPAARVLDMWLRPRTELLPLDTHFWRFSDDPHDSLCALALAGLNLAFMGAAIAGAWLMRRSRYLGLLLAYPLVRTLFLATIGTAEDRYTLECFPFIFVLAALFLSWCETRKSAAQASGGEA